MYIIDVQGFQHKKDLDFTCKEISILNISDIDSCAHGIIKPSIAYEGLAENIKQQINWTTAHLHGLWWSSSYDNLQYNDLPTFISNHVLEREGYVFVKGLEKKRWLEYYLPNNTIVDLFSYNCNKISDLMLSNLNYHCNKHMNNSLRCTKQNVYSIYEWYTVNRDKLF